MISGCIQNIVAIINKDIQKGNNFVNLCFHSKFNIKVFSIKIRKKPFCFIELKTEKILSTYRVYNMIVILHSTYLTILFHSDP